MHEGKGVVAQRGPGVLPDEDCGNNKEREEMSPLQEEVSLYGEMIRIDPYQLTYTNVLLVFFVFIFIPMKILLSSIHLFIHNTLTKHLLCAN